MAELLLYCRLPDGSVAAVEMAADGTVADLRRAAAAACAAEGCVRVSVGGAELRDGGALLADVGLSKRQTVDVARAGLSGKRVLASAGHHTLAILDDGSVAAWGKQLGGCCTVPDFGGRRAVSVAAACERSYALLEDGTIAAWGSGDFSMPSDLRKKRAVSISAGGMYSMSCCSMIAAFDDGAVAFWGEYDIETTQIDSADCATACGLRFGAVVCGSTVSWMRDEEVMQTVVDGVRGVAATDDHLLLVRADGQVSEVSHVPGGLAVSPLQRGHARGRVVAASAGVGFGQLLCEDGTVQTWVSGAADEAAVPKGIFGGERAVAVSAGYSFSCVGLESGRVVAWGQSENGEATVPDFGGRRLMRPSA